MTSAKTKVLFIDNFDSFTYNLVDEFGKRNCDTLVYRADTVLDELKKVADRFGPALLVISPGPGTPDKAGVSLEAIGYFKDKVPIFGVCLGHQCIIQHFGGRIGHAPVVMHGKPSRISHTGKGIFAGLENPLQAGRYHSLCALSLPDCLEQTAEYEGIVMGVGHTTLPVFGVQFHPESVLTPPGGKMIKNLLEIAQLAFTAGVLVNRKKSV
jgi:anthranilate synthase/aminodeoxychorismate synthase-like glutamine amidotransferase